MLNDAGLDPRWPTHRQEALADQVDELSRELRAAREVLREIEQVAETGRLPDGACVRAELTVEWLRSLV